MARSLGPFTLHARPAGVRILETTLQDEAYGHGYRNGRAAAGESEVRTLETALEQLEAASERAQEELAGQAIELAVEIARHLLRVRLDAGEYDLEKIVRGALADSGVGRGNVVVHLSPDDHARLAHVTLRSGTVLDADPNLVPGDVHLSTPRGLLVRDLDAALESIREQLLEELA